MENNLEKLSESISLDLKAISNKLSLSLNNKESKESELIITQLNNRIKFLETKLTNMQILTRTILGQFDQGQKWA